jgi:hypothetical protein
MNLYTLERYHGRGSRYHCPNCNRKQTFTQYVNIETDEPLAGHVGRCNREDGCGYHYPPRQYFAETRGFKPVSFSRFTPAKVFDTLPRQHVENSAKVYFQNNFVCFLSKCLGEYAALKLAELYKIGTSKHWPGATIFWQIDVNDNVRTGKIMLYNQTDGHRVKQPFNHIHWVHSLVSNSSTGSSSKHAEKQTATTTATFQLRQCFFGEHLLHTDPYKTVAIVESEKTAIIASFFYPKYIWLAAGSLQGLSREKYSVLKDRNIRLYPDVNGYEKWKQKAREMRARLPAAQVTVDDTLERVATEEERERGIDIADRWIEQLNLNQ